MNALHYLHQAHAMAVGAADENAAAELTALINDTPDTTDTTEHRNAPIETILSETGIVPSGHNSPENDIVAEVNRLRGELNNERTERENAQNDITRLSAERNSLEDALDHANKELDAREESIDRLSAQFNSTVDPDDYTVQGLRNVGTARGVELPADGATKQELADAINNHQPTDTDDSEA